MHDRIRPFLQALEFVPLGKVCIRALISLKSRYDTHLSTMRIMWLTDYRRGRGGVGSGSRGKDGLTVRGSQGEQNIETGAPTRLKLVRLMV